ncbi:MAG: hypothetical protein VX000_12735, partial [Myxococcota bacterium]|nr:hypothetical protein [Myxococcota bacterium]
MSSLACVVAIALALAPAAIAQEPAPVIDVSPSQDRGPTVEAELRGDYLQGGKIVVPITLRNDTGEAMAVPDLRTRPWLVT